MAPPDPMSTCAGCSQTIETRRFLKCVSCANSYDVACTNVSEKRFNLMTTEFRENKWKCSKCVVKTQPGSDTKTPPKKTVAANDVTITRSRAKGNANAQSPTLASQPEVVTDLTVSSELISEMRLLRDEMKASRTEMQDFKNSMTSSISSLTAAINLSNQRIDDLAARVDAIERRQQQPEEPANNVVQLEQAISDLKLELNDRDQQVLCNDVEISGIDEEKHERTIHLVLSLSAKLGVQLADTDIVSAERVGPLRVAREGPTPRPRPRPLVVRLARRAQRDELLAAARVRRGVTTEGITRAVGSIYINERLTRQNRQLFYKARADATAAQWKYVWTRDGNIYVRKEQGATRHRLRSDADLNKVFGF